MQRAGPAGKLEGPSTLTTGDSGLASITGLVYGVLLNERDDLDRLAPRLAEPPYKGLPKAPVLYVKPYNTHIGPGATVRVPAGVERIATGATLGIVIGRPACRVPEQRALAVVAGYTIVNDLSIPHESLFRPPIREKCFDGACPIGPSIVARDSFPEPDRAIISTYVNGALAQRRTLDKLVRPIARLIADVTEFMTLFPGDVLLPGIPLDAPTAKPGDSIAVEIDGIGRLESHLLREAE